MLLQGPSYDTRRPLRKRRQEPDNAGFCQRDFDAPFVPPCPRGRRRRHGDEKESRQIDNKKYTNIH